MLIWNNLPIPNPNITAQLGQLVFVVLQCCYCCCSTGPVSIFTMYWNLTPISSTLLATCRTLTTLHLTYDTNMDKVAIGTHLSNRCIICLGALQACMAFKIHPRIYHRYPPTCFCLQSHVHSIVYILQWVLMQLVGWQWLLHLGIETYACMRLIYTMFIM